MPATPDLPRVDVLVVLALDEERAYLDSVLTPEHQRLTLPAGYVLTRATLEDRALGLYVLPEMGNLSSCYRIQALLTTVRFNRLVLIGIAGALASNLRLGDVVVAERIDYYDHNGRWSAPRTGSQPIFSSQGRETLCWPMLNSTLLETIETRQPGAIRAWQAAARDRLLPRIASSINDLQSQINPTSGPARLEDYPKLHWGTIASTNYVVDSKVQKQLIFRRNQRYLAVEMEAAGAAYALDQSSTNPRLTVVRGISDLADGSKKEIDEGLKDSGAAPGLFRRYAAENAIHIFLLLLRCGLLDGDVESYEDYSEPYTTFRMTQHNSPRLAEQRSTRRFDDALRDPLGTVAPQRPVLASFVDEQVYVSFLGIASEVIPRNGMTRWALCQAVKNRARLAKLDPLTNDADVNRHIDAAITRRDLVGSGSLLRMAQR